MYTKLALVLLGLFVVAVVGDLSLTSTALMKGRQYYESTVDHATQAVLAQLNKNHEIAKTSKISKVDIEDTKVAESILYSVTLQMGVGSSRGNYGLQFVQPLTPWRSIRSSSVLPSVNPKPSSSSSSGLALLGSSPSYMPPEISLNLTGPMELYLPHATTDLVVKTPRNVDVGFVDRIVLKEGANITLTGSVELRLRDTLSISPSVSDDDEFLLIDTNDKPKLNVYGQHIMIKNTDGEEIKVNKKYSSVLEVSPSSGSVVAHSSRLPFSLPLNDSRIQAIKALIHRVGDSENAYLPSVHQIASGSSAEAVVSFLIPMQVEDEEKGRSWMYDVVVVQGSNHKEAQVISIEKQTVHTHASFSQEIINNGTYPDAVERLNRYLQTNTL